MPHRGLSAAGSIGVKIIVPHDYITVRHTVRELQVEAKLTRDRPPRVRTDSTRSSSTATYVVLDSLPPCSPHAHGLAVCRSHGGRCDHHRYHRFVSHADPNGLVRHRQNDQSHPVPHRRDSTPADLLVSRFTSHSRNSYLILEPRRRTHEPGLSASSSSTRTTTPPRYRPSLCELQPPSLAQPVPRLGPGVPSLRSLTAFPQRRIADLRDHLPRRARHPPQAHKSVRQ